MLLLSLAFAQDEPDPWVETSFLIVASEKSQPGRLATRERRSVRLANTQRHSG